VPTGDRRRGCSKMPPGAGSCPSSPGISAPGADLTGGFLRAPTASGGVATAAPALVSVRASTRRRRCSAASCQRPLSVAPSPTSARCSGVAEFRYRTTPSHRCATTMRTASPPTAAEHGLHRAWRERSPCPGGARSGPTPRSDSGPPLDDSVVARLLIPIRRRPAINDAVAPTGAGRRQCPTGEASDAERQRPPWSTASGGLPSPGAQARQDRRPGHWCSGERQPHAGALIVTSDRRRCR
jgi:hypothetical protein